MTVDQIKAEALALGFDRVGVCAAQTPPHWEAFRQWLADGRHAGMEYLVRHADLREHPEHLLPGAQSVIVVAMNYAQDPDHRPGYPRIARYALGRDYHITLRKQLRRLAKVLEEGGNATRICVDSAPLLERDFAWLSGIGWYGKNTCLIDSRRGSWFLLGSILTTANLEPDLPAIGGCGTCQACIDACPTGAIVFEHDRWQIDARRCISYWTIEHRGPIPEYVADGIGDWTFGCDVCQEVCPFNQRRTTQPLRAHDTRVADFRQVREWPSLVELAEISYERWDHLTRGSPVRRAGHAGIQRNAQINLHNLARVDEH
ncbi:MAG: tRNA epoxyqueuosine(34) reductase QueG [Fimbriimonadaceae bacterium]